MNMSTTIQLVKTPTHTDRQCIFYLYSLHGQQRQQTHRHTNEHKKIVKKRNESHTKI